MPQLDTALPPPSASATAPSRAPEAPEPLASPIQHPLARARLAAALVSAADGVDVEALLSDRRHTAPVAAARQLAMYLAHVGLGLSQSDVARAFQRDRTTVAHACRRIEDQRDNVLFDRRVSRLEACARLAVER